MYTNRKFEVGKSYKTNYYGYEMTITIISRDITFATYKINDIQMSSPIHEQWGWEFLHLEQHNGGACFEAKHVIKD